MTVVSIAKHWTKEVAAAAGVPETGVQLSSKDLPDARWCSASHA